MQNEHNSDTTWLALGMASMVIGLVGLALFFLPILGIPLSLFGLGFGVLGVVAAWFVTGPSQRFSLFGIAISGVALAANLAIANAPAEETSMRARPGRPGPERIIVPPPAVPLRGG